MAGSSAPAAHFVVAAMIGKDVEYAVLVVKVFTLRRTSPKPPGTGSAATRLSWLKIAISLMYAAGCALNCANSCSSLNSDGSTGTPRGHEYADSRACTRESFIPERKSCTPTARSSTAPTPNGAYAAS
jgi:hypothetical protein